MFNDQAHVGPSRSHPNGSGRAGFHLNIQDKKLVSERLGELHVKCRLIRILRANKTILSTIVCLQLLSLNVHFFGVVQHCIGAVVEVGPQ